MKRNASWWLGAAVLLAGCQSAKPEATTALATEPPAQAIPETPVAAVPVAVKPGVKIVAPDMVQKPGKKIVAPDMVQKPGSVAKPPSL